MLADVLYLTLMFIISGRDVFQFDSYPKLAEDMKLSNTLNR